MASSSRVKGITIEIAGDTTKLGKALNNVDRSIYKVSNDLKEVDRLLKLDPTNVDLLAQKGRLLAEKAELSADRLKLLESASKQLDGTLSGTKLEDFNLELDLTKAKAESAAKALEDFDPSLGKLEDSADDLSNNLDELNSSASGVGDGFTVVKGIAADLASGGIKFLADKALELVGALFSLDETTEQYRESIGKLNTAFESAGYSEDLAKEAYLGFYEILGDIDQATEASQLLSQLATGSEDVSKWVKIAAGVYGAFGDSIPIESLIEAANETSKTGKVTGVLADALNWVGLSEESVNSQLEELANSTERARYLMDLLTQQYEGAADIFYENNEALIEMRRSQDELNESLSPLGESVGKLKSQLFDTFGPLFIDLVDAATFALEGLQWIVTGIADGLDWLGDRVLDVIGFFGDLLGISNRTSNVSLPESGTRTDRASRVMQITDVMEIPALASGGVAKKNSPFLAVVGDNTQEDEIIAPYSTVKRAATQGILESGVLNSQRGPKTAVMALDGRTFARLETPYILEEFNRIGVKFQK